MFYNMEPHNLNIFRKNSSFDLTAYFDSNYLTRSIMGINQNTSKLMNAVQNNIQIHNMDIKYKVDQSCHYISGSNMLDQVNLYPKKCSYQIKNYKHLNVQFQDHVNIMPISSSFLIGGYVGSKSQKENVQRTRLNVQIQDFIVNKLLDFAVRSVDTKCRNITKTKEYEINVRFTDKDDSINSLEVNKSSKECIVKSNFPSVNDSIASVISMTKQSYADVTKTTISECAIKNKRMELKPKVPLFKATELKYCQSKGTDKNTKVIRPNNKKSKQDDSFNNVFSLQVKDSAIAFDPLSLHSKNNSHKSHSKTHSKLKEKKNKLVQSNDYIFRKTSDKSIDDLVIKNIKGVSDAVIKHGKNTTILKDHVKNKFFSKKDDIEKDGGIDQFTKERQDFQCSNSSIDEFLYPSKSNSCFGNSLKKSCNLPIFNPSYSDVLIQFSSEDNKHMIEPGNRTISECSVDSEDSFVVFSYDCDLGNCNRSESIDDLVLSDSSCFSDEDCSSPKSKNTPEAEKKELSSTTEKKQKKKVRFCEGDALVKVHTMVHWAYAHRVARVGPWETFARDSARFANRIVRVGFVLSPILGAEHRQKIYKERFASSHNK